MTMERTCKPVAAETINKLTFKDKMRAYKRSPLSLILLLLVCGAALITDADAFIPYLLHSCEGHPVSHTGSFLVHLYIG